MSNRPQSWHRPSEEQIECFTKDGKEFIGSISHEGTVIPCVLIPFPIQVCTSIEFTKQVPAGISYNNSGEMGWWGGESKHLVWLRQSAIKLHLCATCCLGSGQSNKVSWELMGGGTEESQRTHLNHWDVLDPLLSPFHHSLLHHDRL